MLRFYSVLHAFFLMSMSSFAQNPGFSLSLDSSTINGLGGLQAYAFGQDSGRWVLIGGRLDGLHRRQPFASFDVAGNNNRIIVVDPANEMIWSSSLTSLSLALQEQLSSTNMEFHQEGNFLYIIGGYGYNAASASRKTFASMVVVDVRQLISAIVYSKPITTAFRQYNDNKFAVTGGHLETIDDVFYLVGGNRFDGNYNPMGNPTYTQVYTNSIRKFKLEDDGVNLSIIHLNEIVDSANLHRRDYNAVSQIMPDGAEGITAFSGVFQYNVDLPFLNCVNIDSGSHRVQNGFQQYYNHYHCPVLPVYSTAKNEMHTIFFGGIAQFYDSSGVLVQDDNVPFVKTIARVTRNSDGVMAEYKLPIEMPALLGASAEFIRNEALEWYPNGVLKLDSIQEDSVLVGYIFGGISSSEKNIFFVNNGIQSVASSQIFKVYLHKSNENSMDRINSQSQDALQLNIYPNPGNGEIQISFNSISEGMVQIDLFDAYGRTVYHTTELVDRGKVIKTLSLKELENGGVFTIQIKLGSSTVLRKLVLEY